MEASEDRNEPQQARLPKLLSALSSVWWLPAFTLLGTMATSAIRQARGGSDNFPGFMLDFFANTFTWSIVVMVVTSAVSFLLKSEKRIFLRKRALGALLWLLISLLGSLIVLLSVFSLYE